MEFWGKKWGKSGILGKIWKKSEEWEKILDLGKKEGKMLKKEGEMGEKRGKKMGKKVKKMGKGKMEFGKKIEGKNVDFGQKKNREKKGEFGRKGGKKNPEGKKGGKVEKTMEGKR